MARAKSPASVTTRKRISETELSAAQARASEKRRLYLATGALLAGVLLCFADSLWNGFVFDDHGHVLNPIILRSISNLPKVISTERPLRDASYVVDFMLWHGRPFGFHLTNVLLHSINTLMVFLLLRKFTGEVLLAVLGALLFALHPMQSDTVAYVSGRRDILFTLFYLAGLLCYLRYRRHTAPEEPGSSRPSRKALWLALVLICWVLGLLSKEMAASFPLAIFLYAFCEEWRKDDSAWWRRFLKTAGGAFKRDRALYVISVLLLPVYSYYMVLVQHGSSRAAATGFKYWGGSFYTNALTSLRVHAWYLKQFVWPTPFVQYSGAFDVSTSLLEWRLILAVIVVGGVIAMALMLLDVDSRMTFAVLLHFVVLLPVSQLIPHHELLADHYLYLPLVSFSLFVVLLAQMASVRGWASRRLVYAALGAALLAFGIMTGLRNLVYRDDLTLWEANCREAPNSTRALSSLASQHATSYPSKAVELYKRCIDLDPSFAGAYTALAVLLKTREEARALQDRIEQAQVLPDSAITAPGYEDPMRFRSEMKIALALTRVLQGDDNQAEQLLLEAIDDYPTNTEAYELLARYYHKSNPSLELAILGREIDALQYPYAPLQDLSNRLVEQKRYDEALPYLTRMLSLAPNDFYANYQLGQIYRTRTECAKARKHLLSAQSAARTPDDVKAVRDAWRQLQQHCP